MNLHGFLLYLFWVGTNSLKENPWIFNRSQLGLVNAEISEDFKSTETNSSEIINLLKAHIKDLKGDKQYLRKQVGARTEEIKILLQIFGVQKWCDRGVHYLLVGVQNWC